MPGETEQVHLAEMMQHKLLDHALRLHEGEAREELVERLRQHGVLHLLTFTRLVLPLCPSCPRAAVRSGSPLRAPAGVRGRTRKRKILLQPVY